MEVPAGGLPTPPGSGARRRLFIESKTSGPSDLITPLLGISVLIPRKQKHHPHEGRDSQVHAVYLHGEILCRY